MPALEWIAIQIMNRKAWERDCWLEEKTWAELKGPWRVNIEDWREFGYNLKFKKEEYEFVASEWC